MAFGQAGFGNPMFGYAQQGYGRPWQQSRLLYAVMVDGEKAARNYPVPPGEKAIMFDKENSTFFIKEVDEYNAVTFEAYEYTKMEPDGGANPDYVTRAELNEILAQITGARYEPAQEQIQHEPENTPQRMRRAAAREAMNHEQPSV